MPTRTRLLLAVTAMELLAACSDPVTKLVNKEFPPIDRTEAELQLLENSQSAMSRIKDPNVSVYLGPNDIHAAIKAELHLLDGVKDVTASFGPQRLLLSAEVDKTFADISTEVQGNLTGYVIVSGNAKSLLLQPILDQAVISHVKTKRTDLSVLVPALNSEIRKYMDNLNGQIKQITIPIEFTNSISWDPQSSLKAIPGATEVSANPLHLHVALSGMAIQIDNGGVRAIGEAVATSGDSSTSNTAEICAAPPPADPTFDCSTRSGFFGDLLKPACEAGKAFALLSAQSARASRDKLCKDFVAPAPAPKIQPRTEAEFTSQFATYHDEFMSKQQTVVGDKTILKETHVAVLKTFIGSVVNTVFADPAVHVVAELLPPHLDSHPDIHLDDAPNLNCHGNARSCDIQQDCSLDSCDWNCSGWGPGKLGCEINKSSCKGAAPAKKALCEADKSSRKLSCEALKSLEIAGCETNQGWLNQWGGMKVGHLDISADIKGKLDLLLKQIQVKTDLSTVTANLSVTGNAKVDSDIHFVPANIGNLACQAPLSGRVQASAAYQNKNLSISGKVALTDATASDPTRVSITTDQTTLNLQISPPPLIALLTQNPQVAITCTGAVAGELLRSTVASLFGGTQPPELSGQYTYNAGPFTQSLDIKPIDISVPTGDKTPPWVLKLAPKWSGSVVAFVISK